MFQDKGIILDASFQVCVKNNRFVDSWICIHSKNIIKIVVHVP
jgi:hypothetical protein